MLRCRESAGDASPGFQFIPLEGCLHINEKIYRSKLQSVDLWKACSSGSKCPWKGVTSKGKSGLAGSLSVQQSYSSLSVNHS